MVPKPTASVLIVARMMSAEIREFALVAAIAFPIFWSSSFFKLSILAFSSSSRNPRFWCCSMPPTTLHNWSSAARLDFWLAFGSSRDFPASSMAPCPFVDRPEIDGGQTRNLRLAAKASGKGWSAVFR